MKLDLGSLESTKRFIESFKQKNLPLHILICNAGIGFAQQGLCIAYMQYVALYVPWTISRGVTLIAPTEYCL